MNANSPEAVHSEGSKPSEPTEAGDPPSAPATSNSTALVPLDEAIAHIDEEKGTRGPLAWFASLFARRKNGASIRDDLADALSDEQGTLPDFSPEERAMLQSILRLRNLRVEDIMVPRADIKAIDVNTSLAELLREFETSGHSRMPVYDDGLDDPKGMVHIRDLVAHITQTAHVTKADAAKRKTPFPANLDLRKVVLSKKLGSLKVIRPVLFVPPSMMASELMARMQANRIQMALVIDEYGGTDGLVSLEDVVEIIVGDIEDEHDTDDSHMIVDKGDGVFVVDAKVDLDDLKQAMGNGLEIGDLGEDVDTVGGLVFAVIGRVPVRGEVIEAFKHEFRIMEADPRRIRVVEVAPAKRRRPRKADAQHGETEQSQAAG